MLARKSASRAGSSYRMRGHEHEDRDAGGERVASFVGTNLAEACEHQTGGEIRCLIRLRAIVIAAG